MLEYVLFALAGCGIGVVTGLIPGLHINTVAVLGFGLYLSLGLDPVEFVVILTAASVTHAFLDFIPAIFLGAPEEDTALSVLPAHRLFMQGRGFEAVKLTALGSLLGLGTSIILLAPAFYVIPWIYHASRSFIAYVLIVAVIFLVLNEKSLRRVKWAALIFLLSGWLGVVVLDSQRILSTTDVLFPVFAGLFGISTLLDSLKGRTAAVPQEEYIRVGVERRYVGAGFLGTLCGALIGILPAISPSQLGALVSDRAKFDTKNFLVFLSAINTSDSVYSLLALFTIQNPRSGVGVIVGKVLDVDLNTVLLLVGVMAFSASVATILHIEAGRRMARLVGRIDYRKLCMGSLLTIISLIAVFTGGFGLALAILCMIIGTLPILLGVSRTHLMGVLLLPTILFFLGAG